ncbi:MAG: beta-ketoacyl-[acyl-carrier-protein] synthase family protein [Pirellulales bacterium]
MPPRVEVVLTGVGVVSPLGIGRGAFWAALREGRSGIRQITSFDTTGLPVHIAAEVPGFVPQEYVRPRKSLKVMVRAAQLGMAAAELACRDGRIGDGSIDPDRLGVVLAADTLCNPLEESASLYRNSIVDGRFRFDLWAQRAMEESFPLTFLKVLPNILASHISIAHDARGPNNTVHHGDVSSLLAFSEAAHVIQRGMADMMITGGASSHVHPLNLLHSCRTTGLSCRPGDPAAASRPFDAERDGPVRGEGAAAFILEERRHAENRNAPILARVLGCSTACEARYNGFPPSGNDLRRAMRAAMEEAGLSAADLGHVNAHGLSAVTEDAIEALAIRDVVSRTPVTAPKSFFGNLGAAGGAVEMAASVLGFEPGLVPHTLNYQHPDPSCPVNVVHGEPWTARPTALVVNRNAFGQAAAVVLAGAGA